MPIFQLNHELIFPDPSLAESFGLLAVGGDLSVERLILAYRSGIFPWFNEHEPIQWWSPDPRFVLYPSKLKIAKSMRPILRKQPYRVSFNEDFAAVIRACKEMYRPGQQGTWITDEMEQAYNQLHRMGIAHSVEVWQQDELVGGLYGELFGSCFFGESMFSKVSNASKVGFIVLVKNMLAYGLQLIDCQVHTRFLESLGAEMIPRTLFTKSLEKHQKVDLDIINMRRHWRTDFDFLMMS